ncbi:MAG TPA: DUF4907 domain-containing protein [Cytophagaceae bacterium]|jgi:hypothetical protein|nr:DUF4907 domain-containing protein [Cytophagaceae bacterium]
MKKILIPLLCLGLYILYETSTLFFSSPEHGNNDHAKIEYTFKTFPTSNEGWGYSILKEGKQVIRQNQIPAIQGNASFANEADAEKVAKLVVSKLNAGEIPTVTTNDLTALGISVK